MWWKIAIAVLIIVAAAALGGGLWLGHKSQSMAAPQRTRPVSLPPCPASPNCVSSIDRAEDGGHYLAPLKLNQNPLPLLKTALEKSGCRIIASEPDYLQAACTSAFFGFVDDVEFRWAEKTGRLDFRSASRVGYSDLGVNRKRLETLLAGLKAETADQ